MIDLTLDRMKPTRSHCALKYAAIYSHRVHSVPSNNMDNNNNRVQAQMTLLRPTTPLDPLIHFCRPLYRSRRESLQFQCASTLYCANASRLSSVVSFLPARNQQRPMGRCVCVSNDAVSYGDREGSSCLDTERHTCEVRVAQRMISKIALEKGVTNYS